MPFPECMCSFHQSIRHEEETKEKAGGSTLPECPSERSYTQEIKNCCSGCPEDSKIPPKHVLCQYITPFILDGQLKAQRKLYLGGIRWSFSTPICWETFNSMEADPSLPVIPVWCLFTVAFSCFSCHPPPRTVLSLGGTGWSSKVIYGRFGWEMGRSNESTMSWPVSFCRSGTGKKQMV